MTPGLGVPVLAAIGLFDDLANPLLWFSTLVFAVPLALAALGGVISERAGIVNIALEGFMLTGAFFSAWAVNEAFNSFGWGAVASTTFGVVFALLTGALVAAVLAVTTIHLRANQIVVGMALNIIALGLTSFLYGTLFNAHGQLGFGGLPGNLPGIPNVHFPALTLGPLHIGSVSGIKQFSLGYVLFQQNPLVYATVLLAICIQLFLYVTKPGLRLRSAGEHPAAAAAAGVSVRPLRYGAVIVSGALAGLGGSFLVLNGSPVIFTDNITQGRGFIALAAVVIGRWTPLGAVGACLLFGFAEALATTVQSVALGGFQVTSYLMSTLPYLVAIALAVGLAPHAKAPQGLGKQVDAQGAV